MYAVRYAVCLIAASALLGIGIAQATMHYVFPDQPIATEGFDQATWRKCEGRKPVKINKRKYTWYCGPAALVDDEQAGVAGRGVAAMDASTTTRRTSSRSAGSRSMAAGGR
jgi:hypothetical protein